MYFATEQQPVLTLIDDVRQQNLVRSWSEVVDASVTYYHDIESFIETIEEKPASLVLASWDTQRPDAAKTLLERIKTAIGDSTRLIVIAETNPEPDVVTALNIGADRFITSDTSIKIFDAQVRAVMRRIKPDQGFQHFPPYMMNQMTREVIFDDKRIQLTPREFRIAQYLFENRDRVLSREALLRDIWELPDLKYKRRVDTKMSHVRRKMCLDGSYGWQLKFPRGQGYQLNKES